MTVSIGADPEFFVYMEGSGDAWPELAPCVGLVPGSKKKPHDLGDGFFTHEDNVCVELGIPPSPNGWDLGEIVQEGKKRIVTEFFNGREDALYITSAVTFEQRLLNSKQAKEFGCEPDFNAYENGKVRTPPRSLMTARTRYAGGHIHIGGEFNCPPFVAALFADLFLSVKPTAHGFKELLNLTSLRAEFYGRPGIFRPKEYGIEYRTPSNWWTATNEKGNYMGSNAFELGVYLERTGATKLRETVRKINWLAVQELLTCRRRSSSEGRTATKDIAQGIISQVRAAGVPV